MTDKPARIFDLTAYLISRDMDARPFDVCPIIGAALKGWLHGFMNLHTADLLIGPFLPKLGNTIGGSNRVDNRRALLAADWLLRFYTPAWLRHAGLDTEALGLECKPEFTSWANVAACGVSPLPGYLDELIGVTPDRYTSLRGDTEETGRNGALRAIWACPTPSYLVNRPDVEAVLKSNGALAWQAGIRATGRDSTALVSQLQVSFVDLIERMISVKDPS